MPPYEPHKVEDIGVKPHDSDGPKSELGAVKLTRAVSDPIIVHSSADRLPFGNGHEIYDHITQARMGQLREVPLGERIKHATVPEVLIYLYTASFDEQNLNQEFNLLYGYALDHYKKRWSTSLSDAVTEQIPNNQTLEGHHLEKFQELKIRIKEDRDRYFIANRYNALGVETIPKTFWAQNSEGGTALDASSIQLIEDLGD